MRVEQICQQQPTQQNRAALIEGQNWSQNNQRASFKIFHSFHIYSRPWTEQSKTMQEKSSLKINDLPRSCSKKWFRFWRKFSNDILKMRKLFRYVWNIIFWSTFAFQVVTNFFDKSIKTMLDHATVFVTPISELLVQITPNSSPIVDLIQQIISVFSDVKQVRNQESMSQLWRSYSAWMPQTPSMYILSLTASHQSRRSSSQSWYSFICTRYENTTGLKTYWINPLRIIQQSYSKKYAIYTHRPATNRRHVHDRTRRKAVPLWALFLRAASCQSCNQFNYRSEQAGVTARNDHSLWTGLAAGSDGRKLNYSSDKRSPRHCCR
jgi:hypothetical protein